ncbi:class I SAM-dependent methyltransferase [Elongatibacter sediminis]|uniref:class I SAM-dependent methyltransferase n=1 Tax=Elongatibacter sediminis TaxID=3119006 RepID=UPI00339D8505
MVDGLHEFNQALRDVLHLEPHMARDGVIFVHDCNLSTRRHEQDMKGPWNGDVWKVYYFLSCFCANLQFFTLD